MTVFPIGTAPLDPTSVEQAVQDPALPARCTFSGVVRDSSHGHPSTHLVYEAYAAMAAKELASLGVEATRCWPEARVALAHRIGRLEIGEVSVVVAVAAGSSSAALDASRWVMDELKVRVPIWKKEFRPDGAFWIEGPGEHLSGE